MAPTPTRQRNAASEGTALGLLMCGRSELPFHKVTVDLAFKGAWSNWPDRSRFPQVNTDLANGLDPIRALTRVDERKGNVLFWENNRGVWQVVARQDDWSADDPDDLAYAVQMIDDGVPASAWHELACELLRRLESA